MFKILLQHPRYGIQTAKIKCGHQTAKIKSEIELPAEHQTAQGAAANRQSCGIEQPKCHKCKCAASNSQCNV